MQLQEVIGTTDTPLRQVIRQQGRRIDWVAAQVGCNAEQVSKYMSGLHTPRKARRLTFARVLGVQVGALWPRHAEDEE